MERLSNAIDDLSAAELTSAFGPELLTRLGGLLVAQHRLAAEVARTVRACELAGAAECDGLKTMASWLRGHGRMSTSAAAGLVRAGRALAHLPALAAAHAAGAVSAEVVAVVAPITRGGQARRRTSPGRGPRRNRPAAHRRRRRAPARRPRPRGAALPGRPGPDGAEPDPTEGRRLSIAKHADGSISGRFELDAAGGEKLQAALESILQAGRCAGDARTRAQQQADALVQLCDLHLAAGTLSTPRTVKPQVAVVLDAADLIDPATGPGAAELGFGATISAARARWLACDGAVTRIVMGPDGTPLDVGRAHRVVPPHLRRAVERRDRGCVFTGCGAPTHWCDVHHLLE
ncbi:DUF222 domain-containing protein [Geodermatophilus sp. SYSU D00758]